MNREAAEAEVGRLLARREELKRLRLSLPPDQRERLKSLILFLGWSSDLMKLSRREQVIRRLARAAGVKRYAGALEPWKNQPAGPKPAAKIGTSLKAISDASALVPVTEDRLPARPEPVRNPSSSAGRGMGRNSLARQETHVPGGFNIDTRSGRRAFMDYLNGTGEYRELHRGIDDEVQHQAYEVYEPEIDDDHRRRIAEENDWTPEVMLQTLKEQHPESAEAFDQFHRIHTYNPRPDQPNLFDPNGGEGAPIRHRTDPADELADPESTWYSDAMMNHLQTHHPTADLHGVNRTLNWLDRDRRDELQSDIDRALDQDREYYAANMDISDIEDQLLLDMYDRMEQEGRWNDEEEQPEPQQLEDGDGGDEPAQLPSVPMPQLGEKPDQYKPERNKWYKKPSGAHLMFDLPDGRTFEMDVSEHNLNGVNIHNLTFNDDRGSYNQTGKGGAKSVFNQIAPAIVSYMNAKKPAILTFTAAETDSEASGGKSRQKVYEKLVQTLARLNPDYAAGVAQDKSGRGTAAYFVFDRNKMDQVEQVVGQRIARHGSSVRPLVMQRLHRLARRLGVRRYAKADARHTPHPLVEGFPIATALKHLANDPANHPTIRELAKVGLTGGKDRDPANVSMALWSLHDALHEHKHPAKDWYNWMSAGDKVGLDAHTHTALRESAEDQRRSDGPNFGGMPDANQTWTHTPEAHATMAVQGMEGGSVNSAYSIDRPALLSRIRQRVQQLSPSSQEKDIDESIRRHAHRSKRVWAARQGWPADSLSAQDDSARDLGPYKERKFPVPRPHLNTNEKATRYRRLLRRLARNNHSKLEGLKRYAKRIKKKYPEGYISPEGVFHPVGPREMHEHVAARIGGQEARKAGKDPRRVVEGLGYMHVGFLEPDDLPAGEQAGVSLHGYHPDRNFTGLQVEKLKELAGKHGINEVTLDGGGQSKPVKMRRSAIPKRYEMVAGDFIDALRRIRSEQQKGIRHTVETIAAKIGAKPASTVDALADSPHYSVPGVAQAIYSNTAPEAIHALAAWAGLTGNIPGMAVFHYRPSGPDLLHRFRMAGSGQELRAKLDKSGLTQRVLVPFRSGYDVLIPDVGGKLNDTVKDFTKRQKTELQTSSGHFKTMGSSDQARAREMFRDTVTKQEQSA